MLQRRVPPHRSGSSSRETRPRRWLLYAGRPVHRSGSSERRLRTPALRSVTVRHGAVPDRRLRSAKVCRGDTPPGGARLRSAPSGASEPKVALPLRG